MGWVGRLELRYRRSGDAAAARTVGRDRHHGPLRVLQALYPEGDAVCHHVLVHPPGGIVGGDALAIDVTLEAGAHALITTPGATRFYRSRGERAEQVATVRVGTGARLDWLPLETLVYPSALAANRQSFDLAPGARMIGWDLLALGLPASDQPFAHGCFEQHLELPGLWLERGRIDAADIALLRSPLGLDGQSVMATLFAAAGDSTATAEIDALLAAARDLADPHPLAARCGVTALPRDRGVVLRALAPRVEPALHLLTAVWAAWRKPWLGRDAVPPRIWRT